MTNTLAQFAMSKLSELEGAQAHSTVILNKDDEQVFRKLGIDVTCDDKYQSTNLYEG